MMTELRAYVRKKQIAVISAILIFTTLSGLDLAGAFGPVDAPMWARLFFLLCAAIGAIYLLIATIYMLHPGPVLIISDVGVHFPHRLKEPINWSQIAGFKRAVDSSGFETITFDLRQSSRLSNTVIGALISIPFLTLPGPRINPRVMDRTLDEVESQLRHYIR